MRERPDVLRSRSGATTLTRATRARAFASARSPGASTPSSLVIRIWSFLGRNLREDFVRYVRVGMDGLNVIMIVQEREKL